MPLFGVQEEELSVTSLHAKAKQHQPNTAILNKLKEEMEKLQMRRVSPSPSGFIDLTPEKMVLTLHYSAKDLIF